MKHLFALLLVLVWPAIALATPALPGPLVQDFPGLQLHGEGKLRFVGFKVYDAALWTTDKSHSFDRTFALDLRYAMKFAAHKIVETSVAEMRRVGYTDDAKLAKWASEMARVFPDVKAGDHLAGVMVALPDGSREAHFYSSTRLLGIVKDSEFARAFFDIWLHPKTRAPDLRRALLRLTE